MAAALEHVARQYRRTALENRMNALARLLAVLVFGSVAASAVAATATATMTVSAAVAGACSVIGNPVRFGGSLQNSLAENVDGQGSVTAICATGTPFTVALNQGIGAGATFAARRMRVQSGSATMVYALYTDPGRTTVWGDGTAGSAVFSTTSTGASQIIPVYGRIPSGQTLPNGLYVDTVTVTLTF
jgi:spore coat protein U-like protein